MRNIDHIPASVADLESQEFPNVKATAEKHDVMRKTLENRWKGKSVSTEERSSIYRQCLTNFQEKALCGVVNGLTDSAIESTCTSPKLQKAAAMPCPISEDAKRS